jgi:3-oxoacyl-[acyl-carrier protein] reductase
VKLKGKVAVITGAGRGLGRAIALAFAEEGADTALAARTKSQVEETAELVRARGRRAAAVTGDVSNYADACRLAEAAAELGGIDAVVNNAGVYVRRAAMDFPPEEWEKVIRINLVGAFYVVRASLPAMIAAKAGAVVNIASIHGLTGDEKISAHIASKFGLVGLTQALAKELREHNITVNAVCPGAIAKDDAPSAAPLKALVSPKAVARLCVYLAAQDPPSITGASIPVYAGTDTKVIVHSP